MQDFRGARASIREALRRFRWVEYRPFTWLMAIQLLFLVLASNLGTTWGMAGAGPLLHFTSREGVHYPSSFLVLPTAFSYLESFLFVTLGSFLIPLSLVRVLASADGSAGGSRRALGRAAAAIPATVCALLLNVGLLYGWQWIFSHGPRRWIHFLLVGALANFAGWFLSAIVSCAIAAVFVYVPIRAVTAGSRFSDAFLGGIQEGFRYLGPTMLTVFLFTWPVLIFLAPAQLGAQTIVAKFHPELVAVSLGVVALLNSFMNYLIYSAVARLHRLGARPEG